MHTTKSKINTILKCFILISCSFIHQSYARTPVNYPTISAVDVAVEEELIMQNTVGAAIGVVKNGQIVHLQGYGHTSLNRDIPITTQTIFRWASISKTLTAVAALKMEEEANCLSRDEEAICFSIKDKVSDHVGYWPSNLKKGDITVKHLLSNRSGIIHYKNRDNCSGNTAPDYDKSQHVDEEFNPKQAIDVFKNAGLCFDPGSDYKYSTFGFSLAAAAIQEASNSTYAEWVKKKIANVAGMTTLRQATGSSHGYNLTCGQLIPKTEGSKAFVLPGGGWESTIADLALFGNAILQGSLLDDTARLWTERTGNQDHPATTSNPNYWLGINLSDNGKRVWHRGTHEDTHTFMKPLP